MSRLKSALLYEGVSLKAPFLLSKEVTGILFRHFRRLDYWLDEEFKRILNQEELQHHTTFSAGWMR